MPVDQGVCSKDLRVIHMKAHDRLFLRGELEVLRPDAERHLLPAMAWNDSLRERKTRDP